MNISDSHAVSNITDIFGCSEETFIKSVAEIAQRFDVTSITEKQKTALSKALFDTKLINAIEHAILSLPSQSINATLARRVDLQKPINLLEIYQEKALSSPGDYHRSSAKILDEKFLCIMQTMHQERV